ncbi:FGGY family carbohydrate kinase [Pseudomonas mucidolens]|uniref:ATP:glycerol 3-phosphotransferase n=1 Tax=Pseudomonas mucidolens TaxID=46679 RepID=A0A1H2MGX6_9PSED|nr:FGGY-family carbohydrate kinase [Pseudomonas mucidolens]SDU92161.1 glycerol kinase [Pseudomonas mucidolens]SQH33931.1 glycerol kinase [Pseudomonas mucidolens]
MNELTPLILAIDEGTSNAKAVLVNELGQVIARGSRPLSLSHPQDGFSEQDPEQIWANTLAAIDECLSGIDRPLSAVAISNQRESVVAWDRRTGEALSPCISWQCRRSTPLCAQLHAQGAQASVLAKTGLALDPMFSAGKMRWILDHLEQGHARAAAGEICLGTVDSWLLYKLSGGQVFATDYSNAARTQLFNLHTQAWDPELLVLFAIPLAALPRIQPSAGFFAETVATGRLPAGIPVMAMIGDSHAALYGQGGFVPGLVKATLGTGTSLMTPMSGPIASTHGLSTTLAWHDGTAPTYAMEGNIVHTGAAVQWASRLVAGESLDQLTEQAAQLPDNGGVYFVPALSGLGAPHWQAQARGLICGLTEATSGAHILRASLESIGYQIRDVFDAMQQDTGSPMTALWVDGGATRNRWLMQFLANLLQCPVVRSLSPEVSALGAAHLAGRALGIWSDDEALAQLERPRERFEPETEASMETHYSAWKRALERTLC